MSNCIFLFLGLIIPIASFTVQQSPLEKKLSEQRYNTAKKAFLVGATSGALSMGIGNSWHQDPNDMVAWILTSGVGTSAMTAVVQELNHAITPEKAHEKLAAYHIFAATGLGYISGAVLAAIALKVSGKNGVVTNNSGEMVTMIFSLAARMFADRYTSNHHYYRYRDLN